MMNLCNQNSKSLVNLFYKKYKKKKRGEKNEAYIGISITISFRQGFEFGRSILHKLQYPLSRIVPTNHSTVTIE